MSSLGNVTIIREIYDSEHPEETFERELDRALEAGFEAIIIEPARLGDETARWIWVGNCLHKCAVLFGVSSICLSVSTYRNTLTLVVPLSMGSVFCAGLYMISWQFDPCCKYQVASGADLTRVESACRVRNVFREAASFEFASATVKAAPTVLVRRNDNTRKLIHTAIASIALALAVIRFCT